MKLIKLVVPFMLAVIHVSSISLPVDKDRQFLIRASQASEAEIIFGKLAHAKSTTDSIRNMAGETVKEHQVCKNDLMILCEKLNIKPPEDMEPEHLMKLEAIQKLSGKSFDVFYLNEQNLDHQQLTILYEIEIREGTDSLVISFAKKHLPALKTHLKMFHFATNGLIQSTNQ